MTSCNCLLCRSTCRVVGYLFKILKRSKEANNKRQRLESKLYIGFLLFIFSSSSYLWIAFSISNCLFRSVFFERKILFICHFHVPFSPSFLFVDGLFWVFSVSQNWVFHFFFRFFSSRCIFSKGVRSTSLFAFHFHTVIKLIKCIGPLK